MLTPPTVLLDRSFLSALTAPEHAAGSPGDDARTVFAGLVERYERHDRRLLARHDHLRELPRPLRRSLLAPVEEVHVAAQHRRLAARLPATASVVALTPDDRVTLVILRHERIHEIAAHGGPARCYSALGLTVIG